MRKTQGVKLNMKAKGFIGTLVVALGICLGLYVGFWVMFVGGVMDVVEQVRAEVMSKMVLALGIAKILFASFVGWVIVAFSVFIGTELGS
jgi:hypothetical protein